MNHNNRLRIVLLCLGFLGLSFLQKGISQIQTPRYISMIPNSNGFYEYLPQGYNPAGSQTYPLLLFIHGLGELGSGNPASLPLVLRNGPPKLISQGIFPTSFTVNGQTHSFIVISPQFIDWPTPTDVNSIINYLLQNYKVDPNRLYLTGLSMGGGVTWEYPGDNSIYANRLAAILPICGASWPDHDRARFIANANLAVWATHNDGDPTAPVFYTNDYITYINEAPTPTPPAKKTIFQSNTHDAWTKTYDLNFKENGLNVYEWMLQYQRNITVLPVTLSNYKATKTGDSQITITWSTTSELNNDHFTLERSANGIDFTRLANIPAINSNTGSVYSYADNAPLDRNNFYRLSQTDRDGKITYYTVLRINMGPYKQHTLSIYPNPVKNNVTIDLFHQEKGNIQVILSDVNGKTLRLWKFQKQEYEWQQLLNIQNIKPGTYLLRVISKTIKESLIFVKVK